MLEPSEAVSRILSALEDVAPLPAERVPLADALGRVLGEDVTARRALPPHDNAQMDGYALRAADAPRPGARLPVAFEVFAGGPTPPPLPPGACARVFTGAPIPAEADAVEMQEEVARDGATALFRRAGERGRFVRAEGSDIGAGAVALPRGTLVDPGAVGLLAALGRSEVPVYRRPRVALLSTGDEIVPIDEALAPGHIVDSNSHALAASCREAGALPVRLPLVRDQRGSIESALAAADGFDVLITSGGVSVGDRDLVRAALEAAGTRLDFWRVAMRPGKPIAFGRRGRGAVFGLPGNPASALVTFELFVRPALRRLAGLVGTGRTALACRLGAAVEKPPDLTQFVRARAYLEGGDIVLEPLPAQGSGQLTSVTGFDALAVLPKGAGRLRRGSRVEGILLAPPRTARASAPAVSAPSRSPPRGPARRHTRRTKRRVV